MARERDPAHSFDPRTWGGEVRPAQPPTRPATAKPPTSATSYPAARARPAPASTASTSALWIAFGGAAILLILGAVATRLYPSRPPTPAASASVAASPPAEASNGDHQTLTVGEPAAIADALRGMGVSADVADGAAREVASMLASEAGSVTLVVDLTGPANAREMTRLEATRATGGVVLTARPDGSYSSEPLPTRMGTAM